MFLGVKMHFSVWEWPLFFLGGKGKKYGGVASRLEKRQHSLKFLLSKSRRRPLATQMSEQLITTLKGGRALLGRELLGRELDRRPRSPRQMAWRASPR